jgi:hypothetical protein
MDKPPGHLKPYRRNQKNIPLITLITLISGDKKKQQKYLTKIISGDRSLTGHNTYQKNHRKSLQSAFISGEVSLAA